MVRSQWDCVLENLGEWHGSFTSFSPEGEELKDIPSVITLEGRDDNHTIALTLKRFYPEPVANSTPDPARDAHPHCHELTMAFSQPGAGTLFFESGAFSSGPQYASPSLKFVSEFCLVTPERRSRQVQLFDVTGQCQQITLIREKRAGCEASDRPHLEVTDLLGTWQQEKVTRTANRPDQPERSTSTLVRTRVSPNQLEWHQHSHHPNETQHDLDTRKPFVTQLTPSLLTFEQDGHSFQIILLPNGAFSTYPVQLQPGHPFFVEVGWMIRPGHCQRLIRQYTASGDWQTVTFITETQ